jgi:ABC-type transport system substrate-binding protein
VTLHATRYSNPEADALIDQARTSSNEHIASSGYTELRQSVFDDALIIFVHYKDDQLPHAEERRRQQCEPDARVPAAERGVHRVTATALVSSRSLAASRAPIVGCLGVT